MISKPVILWDDFHVTLGSGHHGSGVNHRARQIGELLAQTGANVVPIRLNPRSVGKIAGGVAGATWFRGPFLAKPSAWRSILRQGRRLAATIAELRLAPGSGRCVVWGNPDNWVVALAARACGLPLVAVPCDFGVWLNDQIRMTLSTALAPPTPTFCISEYEQWLLRGFGVCSDYLPYRPTNDWANELLAIRAHRAVSIKTHDLVLSSYTNPYNRAGMKHLAELIQGLGSLPRPMLVGGYDTEQYTNWFPPQVKVEGTLSDKRLHELLIGANSVILDQDFGGGVSTRVADALTAGISVIATRIAARSWTSVPGVYLYDSALELARYLTSDLAIPPPPVDISGSERRFVEAIQHSLGINN